MATINPHTTRAAGTILTAAIYNADHVNHISNSQNLNNDKLEGATPPVVDGHAILWLGTSGAAMKTAGFAPANAARTLQGTAPVTIAGDNAAHDLTANRIIALTLASQAEAEAAANNVNPMTALRVRQWFDHANAKASQADAEGVTVDTKWLSPLKWRQAFNHANQKANQAEAEAGVEDTKWLSSLRVKQAIAVLAPKVWSESTSSSELTYPIGQVLMASSGSGAIFVPNSTVAVYRGASASWLINLDANGSQLTGTWRTRGHSAQTPSGEFSTSATLVQRVA